MSNSDARISVSLPTHPKTKKLKRRLGAEGVLSLVYLFLWASQNKPSGDLSGMSDEDIELAVDWDGDIGLFVSTLSEVGFIDGDEFEREIHDWAEHNPWASGAEMRADRARFAALCKQHGRKKAAEIMPEYAASTVKDAKSCDKESAEQAISTPDSANSTDQAVLDSANSTQVAGFSSAPSPSPSPSPNQKPAEPIGSLGAEDAPNTAKQEPTGKKNQKAGMTKPLSASDLQAGLPGLSEAVALDYLTHRKAKKSTMTASAWAAIAAEVRKSNLPPDEALSEAMAAGWTGFKADWLQNLAATHPHQRPAARASPPPDPDASARFAARIQGQSFGRVIEGERA